MRKISIAEDNRIYPEGYEMGWSSMIAHKMRGGFCAPFEFYKAEMIDNGIVLTGANVIGTIKSGKNKGRKKYDIKRPVQVFVTKEQADQEKYNWEEITGKCYNCLGHGEITTKISVTDGIKTLNTCKRCGGSGNKPEQRK